MDFDTELEKECVLIAERYSDLCNLASNLTTELVFYIEKQYLRDQKRSILESEHKEIIKSLQKGAADDCKRKKMYRLAGRAIQILDGNLAKEGLIQPKNIRFCSGTSKRDRLKWFKSRFKDCELPDSLKEKCVDNDDGISHLVDDDSESGSFIGSVEDDPSSSSTLKSFTETALSCPGDNSVLIQL
jgi:hypothetical protein